jgi:hypothetical protein
MKKNDFNTVIIGLGHNEVNLLCVNHKGLVTDSKTCNSSGDWPLVIKDLFTKNKISPRALVKVMLYNGVYSVAQLPKNELLTEEELHGIAMYKDLDGAVPGRISDYTWDFYDTKTSKSSKPTLTFVLVEKRIISVVATIINSLAVLDKITISDLAMADFISFYQYVSLKKENPTNSPYIPQLCITLFLANNHELMVYGVYNGELCYSRALKGYKTLSGGVVGGPNDPLLSRLTTEILRLSDDFFTSQLGLPPFSKLLVIIDSDQLEAITDVLSLNFRRVVEVIPLEKCAFARVPNGYTLGQNEEINLIANKNINFLPLYGLLKEGLLKIEKN